MLAPRRRSASFAAALVVVATLLLGLPTVPTVAASTDDPTSTSEVTVAPANGTAVVGLDKQASPDTLAPGQETEFRVVVSCSSLEVPCANLVVEDVLPAEFDVTSLPASNSQRTVIWEPVTRQLQVTFIVPLGGGQFGLPAGSSQAIAIGMRLPSETAVIDGQVITNTATATADLAHPGPLRRGGHQIVVARQRPGRVGGTERDHPRGAQHVYEFVPGERGQGCRHDGSNLRTVRSHGCRGRGQLPRWCQPGRG